MNNTSNFSIQNKELQALTSTEKRVISTLKSLDNDKNCFASNSYLAETLFMSERQVSRVINSLKDKGYIEIDNPRSFKRKIRVLSEFIVVETIKEDKEIVEQEEDKEDVNDFKKDRKVVDIKKCNFSTYTKKQNKAKDFCEMDSRDDYDWDEIERLEQERINRMLKGGE